MMAGLGILSSCDNANLLHTAWGDALVEQHWSLIECCAVCQRCQCSCVELHLLPAYLHETLLTLPQYAPYAYMPTHNHLPI